MSLILPEPRRIDPASVLALRWGVIGTGIADAFVGAIHAHTTQRAVAVAARDAARTADFAARHGIPVSTTDVEAVLTSPDVDVVYIATPHPLHHDAALAAIAAGKHVLIEKPIAMSAVEARSITDAGRAAGVLVMEAMWSRYLPQHDVVRRVIADGVIGDVRHVTADFGFVVPFDAEHRMWNAELGGGALLDAGVYPVSFANAIIGAPSEIHVTGETGVTGVDTSAHLALRTADGRTAHLSTSIDSVLPVRAGISGTEGRIDYEPGFFVPTTVTVRRGQFQEAEVGTFVDDRFDVPHDGLSYQATALASYVAEGRVESPVHPHHEVVSVMATIDAARAAIAGRAS